MRFSTVFVPLSIFAAAVQAITVTSPRDGDTWSIEGPNTVSWTSVSSDPNVFQIILTNPAGSQVQTLVAQQATTSKTVQVRAPSGDFPTGSMWRVNLMSTTNTGSILAQSGYFNITDAVASVSGSVTLGAATAVIPTTMSGMTVKATSLISGPTATGTGATSTAVDLNPTGTSGAAGFFQLSTGLVAVVAAIHAFAF